MNHDGPVWGVAISPTNDRIVSGSWDTTVRLWDADTGKELTRRDAATGETEPWFGRLESPVQSVAMSHDGRLVAAGGWDGTVKLWQVGSGVEVTRRRPHYLPVFGMAFSPDDRYLATASGDRTAKLWQIGEDKEIPLDCHSATVYSVAFDKTGRHIATASWDRSIGLWQFADGRVRLERRLNDAKEGHKDYVYGLAFSPNGQRLATVSNDKTLRFWDVETGRKVGETRTLRGVAWDVAYHPDGDRLATAIWNPTCWVKVWPGSTVHRFSVPVEIVMEAYRFNTFNCLRAASAANVVGEPAVPVHRRVVAPSPPRCRSKRARRSPAVREVHSAQSLVHRLDRSNHSHVCWPRAICMRRGSRKRAGRCGRSPRELSTPVPESRRSDYRDRPTASPDVSRRASPPA